MKHTSLYLAVAIITILMAVSCKNKQRNINSTIQSRAFVTEDIIHKASTAQPDFKTMNISKMTMLVNYGQYSFTFRGSLRIITDSVVSISIQPALGIEMFRIEFQPSGFAVYDKMNRRYSQNSYNYIYLKSGININYKSIEALFSHKLFTPTSTDTEEIKKYFEIKDLSTDTLTLTCINTIAGINQRFDITPQYRISLTGVEKNNTPLATITYGELKRFDHIHFPKEVNLNVQLTNETIKAKLYIDKISFNEEINTAPINLTRYTKSSFTEIISKRKL